MGAPGQEGPHWRPRQRLCHGLGQTKFGLMATDRKEQFVHSCQRDPGYISIVSMTTCLFEQKATGGGDIPAAHEHPTDLGRRENWSPAKRGPRSLEIQLLLKTRLSLTLAGMWCAVLHARCSRALCVSLRSLRKVPE